MCCGTHLSTCSVQSCCSLTPSQHCPASSKGLLCCRSSLGWCSCGGQHSVDSCFSMTMSRAICCEQRGAVVLAYQHMTGHGHEAFTAPQSSSAHACQYGGLCYSALTGTNDTAASLLVKGRLVLDWNLDLPKCRCSSPCAELCMILQARAAAAGFVPCHQLAS